MDTTKKVKNYLGKINRKLLKADARMILNMICRKVDGESSPNLKTKAGFSFSLTNDGVRIMIK